MLVRHASVDSGGRLCGSLDLPLSPQGRADLAALTRRVRAAAAPDALFTSTLARAMEVAAALATAWGVPAHPAAWAREIDCGDVEGVRLDRIQQQHPDLWARNEAQADDAFAWPAGESYAAFRARILAGLRRAAVDHAGERLAVITHAGVISQVLGVIRGRAAAVWRPDRPRPLTATEIVWEGDAPRRVLSYDARDWT